MAQANGITITPEQLRATAKEVSSINQQLHDTLTQINKAMDNLETDWQSEASTEIRANMNAMKPRFEEYKNVVDSYSKFLETTATDYDTTEETIKKNASAFK